MPRPRIVKMTGTLEFGWQGESVVACVNITAEQETEGQWVCCLDVNRTGFVALSTLTISAKRLEPTDEFKAHIVQVVLGWPAPWSQIQDPRIASLSITS